MSCLSIFVDESGDFGPYNPKSPYYIVTLIIHDQSKDISKQVQSLNDKIQSLGFNNDFVIHTAPLIRREEIFANESPNKRRSLFISLFFFVLKSPISYKTFVFEKRQGEITFSLRSYLHILFERFYQKTTSYSKPQISFAHWNFSPKNMNMESFLNLSKSYSTTNVN